MRQTGFYPRSRQRCQRQVRLRQVNNRRVRVTSERNKAGMESIQVTLPDGKTLQVPRGTTPKEIARKISPRLAEEALVARVTPVGNGAGELVDLTRPLEGDAKLAILTRDDPQALEVFRHSAAHLLAAAVLELFPNVKLGIGPPIEHGFFYEFLREEPFTSQD